MRITKLNIPHSEQTGLGPIAMERLGDIVILAGKNGSGKTRLFKAIQDFGNGINNSRIDSVLSNFLDGSRLQKDKNISKCELLWKVCNTSTNEFSDIRVLVDRQVKSISTWNIKAIHT